MIVLNHGASFAVAERRGARPRARPPRDDGRRGPAPRARRDRRSSTPIRRGWAGSWRRSGGPSSSPTSCGPGERPRPGRGHPGLPERAGRRLRSTRARPALPRQGDDRARDHPRHRRARRLAAPGPAGRHRPLEAGLLRGQAGARAQGRATAAWAPLGEGNATVERAEPTRYQPDWGGRGRAAARLALTSSRAGRRRPGLVRRLAAGGRSVVPSGGTRA